MHVYEVYHILTVSMVSMMSLHVTPSLSEESSKFTMGGCTGGVVGYGREGVRYG